MKLKAAIVGLVALLLSATGNVLGCGYFGTPHPPASYVALKVKRIFIGRVVGTSLRTEKFQGQKYQIETVSFTVLTSLKGIEEGITKVEIRRDIERQTSCSVSYPKFSVGQEWLVHDDIQGDDENYLDPRFGSDFQRFVSLSQVEFKEYFRRLEDAIANPVTGVSGHFRLMKGVSLQEPLVVEIEGEGFRRSFKTTEDGYFSFENLKAGRYVIRVHFETNTEAGFGSRFLRTVFDPTSNKHLMMYEVDVREDEVAYSYLVLND